MGNNQGDLKKTPQSIPIRPTSNNLSSVSQTARPTTSRATVTGTGSRVEYIANIPIHTSTSRNPPLRNPPVYNPPPSNPPSRNPPVYTPPPSIPPLIPNKIVSASTSTRLYPTIPNLETSTTTNIQTSNVNLKRNIKKEEKPALRNLEEKMDNLQINQTNIAQTYQSIFREISENNAVQGSSDNNRNNRRGGNNNRGGRNKGRGDANSNPNRGRGGANINPNRGRGGATNNPNRGENEAANRANSNRGNRGGRGGNRGNRGRNLGPGILPTPNAPPFNEMDWFNMAPSASNPPNQGFSANDLPIRNNYGGRYNNEDTRSESNASNRGGGRGRGRGRGRGNNRPQFMGFKKLEEIFQMDPDQIVVGLCSEEAGFEKLLKTDLTADYIVLVIRVISKCCQTTFQQNKAKILARVCEKDFADQLIKYLNEINLHDSHDRNRNKFFWFGDNKNLFWKDLLVFYESVIQLIPNTAVEVLPKIIKQTILTVTHFETIERIPVPDSVKASLEDLQMKLMLCAEEREKKKTQRTKSDFVQDEDPPDDFRQISLYPMVHEVTDRDERVFLRANIIDGGYQNVDHYLDVHFRLLREDFVAPLRDGICQHLSQQLTKERKRIFNVRFYEKVTFVSKYTVQDKVGVIIQLNMGKRKVKLENTRRFMFGSLLCFTNNNFQSVAFGTVLSRDRNLIEKNQIAIDLVNENVSYEAQYTMVECNVFFDPYYHVMKALQNMTEDTFPLKRYIIDVEPEVFPPRYLQEFSILEHKGQRFYALQKERWPSAQSLGLDNSQYRAFQSALTKEFCVIQGPPGTGKTFIGLRITQVLLENHELWNSKRNPILVICFTNHALDQFLEGICVYTQKLVRIGGQSKNENLKAYNIREMRTKYNRTKQGSKLMYKRRDEIRSTMNEIQRLQKILDGIMDCNRIIDIKGFDIIDVRMMNSWFSKAKKPELLEWLMGGRTAEERYQERKKQRIAHHVAQNVVVVDDENASDSEDDYFDPEEEAQREIDDVDHIFASYELSSISSHSLLTKAELEEKINLAARLLADIEVKAEETNNFTVFDERGTAQGALNKLHEDYEYFNYRMHQLKSGTPPPRPLIIDYNDPLLLPPNERWGLYAYWLNLYRNSILVKVNKLHQDYREVYQQYEEVKQMEDIKLMKDMQVIGMTTCGAARYQTILQALKCPIVIVEEAAEVLESHVVVSLTSDCQHLILIGDHKQLRPTTAEFRLRKNCNLDISLFERMVTNKIHCETLEIQHRMRPEIVKLIVPAIYPKLDSSPSVWTYPPVQGVSQNLFFITHTEAEEAVDDSGSRKNVHEAKFLIKLARHLILQGYEPEDITILAAYSGQMFCLWKERKNLPLLKDVRITGVDNYQGEENKIILLSLVRSNSDSNIGFLKTDNRVNVALSRAKEGLYIIGNMSILEKSDNAWPKIKQTLEETNQIGPYLTLQCQVHREEFTHVRAAEDFQKVTEGGCTKLCGGNLNCGHVCGSLCHVTDREHIKYKCKERCTKGLCEIGHPCPLKCYEECRPCEVPLSVILKCGHHHDLPCHMNDTSNYQCPTKVDTKLECGHVAPKPCYRNVKKFPCPHPCEVRKLCGHACERRCHIYDDPDHLQSKCFKQCGRASKGCLQTENPHKCLRPCYEDCMDCEVKVQRSRNPCGHVWTVPCRESVDEMKCTRRCKNKLNCGHNCKLECWEPCGQCDVKVDKIVASCGHKVNTKCSEAPDRSMCRGVCPRPLPCGHPCNKKCNEPCRTSCTFLVDSPFNAACGHRFKIPCSKARQGVEANDMELLKYCQEPCKEILQCEHPCAGTCGSCAQGRIHTICKEKCGATLICGHECDIPCREICQPCNKKCYYRCAHSKCGKKCGEPCAECKEPCTRCCIHGRCTRLCSEPCNQPPCKEPCPRLLRCKHPCIGFCGEPCPPVCRVCDKDDETFICFFGEEDEPDSRFVYLEECKHSIEANAMDTWMQQKPVQDESRSHEINVKCCPKCKTIIMTQRYSEYIKQVFRDIIAIKKKVYLEDEDSSTQRAQLQTELATLRQDNLKLYKESQNLKSILVSLQSALVEVTKHGKRNPINKIALENCRYQIELLRNVAAIVKKANLHEHPVNFNKCVRYFDTLLDYLNVENLSKQNRMDLNMESKRFEKIVHLLIAESNRNFAHASTKAAVKRMHENLRTSIHSIEKYSTQRDVRIRENLKTLCEEIDRSIVLQEHELKMVINAMQMGVGHWYKCPNGHLYVITECGGAVVTGRCNECGAAIGGSSHRHLSDNQRLNIGVSGAARGYNY